MAPRAARTTLETASSFAIGDGLDGMRSPLERARHLPGYIYNSPEFLQLEKERIFMKDWLALARVEELANPGDFMTFRILDEPVVIARDNDGNINAFSNVCAHRGVEVVAGAGNAAKFSCPYHGWQYDLTGKLLGAPYMKDAEAFDPSGCRLRPLRHDLWAGWIFVNFDLEAAPLADFVSDYDREFGFLKQEDCRLAFKVAVDLDCNWKFAVENLIDIYHVTVIHKNTIGRKRGDPDRYPFNLLKNGGTSMFYDSAPMTPTSESLFGNMPWFEGKPVSFASSGRLAPNFQMFSRSDNVHHFVMWPIGVDKTRIMHYTLFPEAFVERPDFDANIKIYRDYVIDVMREDQAMVQSLQKAQHSLCFEPGPLSKLEKGIYHVLNNHLDRIFGAA